MPNAKKLEAILNNVTSDSSPVLVDPVARLKDDEPNQRPTGLYTRVARKIGQVARAGAFSLAALVVACANESSSSQSQNSVFLKGYDCPKVVTEFNSRYGPRGLIITTGPHKGTDIAAPYGTAFSAIASGEVAYLYKSKIGNWIAFVVHSPEDTGLPYFLHTYYIHAQEKFAVERFQKVKPGQVLGYLGDHEDGPHLHLEIWTSEKNIHWPIRDGKGDIVEIRVGGNAKLMDPMSLYKGNPGYLTEDGSSKVLSPLPCRKSQH